ncbi:hypothetical protein DKG34_00505 [Streptomyces sp. NWU49]|nr:hypothetical protein DKG34_00505 [Streptomyces sp. NWU49]
MHAPADGARGGRVRAPQVRESGAETAEEPGEMEETGETGEREGDAEKETKGERGTGGRIGRGRLGAGLGPRPPVRVRLLALPVPPVLPLLPVLPALSGLFGLPCRSAQA